MYGLKVRGQRTRCTGRKGGAVGVAKGGKIMHTQAGGAGAPAADAEGEQPTTETKDGTEKKDAPKTESKDAPKTEKKDAPKTESKDAPAGKKK